MTTTLPLAVLAAALACCLAGTARADDALPSAGPTKEAKPAAAYPYIEGELGVELSNDYIFQSDDPGNEIDDLYVKGELAVKLGLTPIFSANLGLTLEPVLDPRPYKDRFFTDHGLYVDMLNLQADIGGFTFVAGKFEPIFGRAWDATPGVFGTDFAEDYELAEETGFGASYKYETGGFGTYTLAANLFYTDRSFLSDSVFARRGRTLASAGGAGNTGRLDNVSFSLDGEELPHLPGISFHAGYRHLSAGVGDFADEDGVVGGLQSETKLENGFTLGFLGEVAYFSNYGGTADNAVYVTGGTSLKKGPWHGELAGTLRDFDFAAGGTGHDYLAQISGGYEFENGFDLSIGYGMSRDAGVSSQAIGLRLAKTFSFSTRK